MRSIGRRLRSSFGIGAGRMTIRTQRAWYWRWLINVLMMALVGTVVWWLVQNSYRITGFDIEDVRQQMGKLTQENRTMKAELEAARATLVERERQLQIEKASQGELARNVAQLQDENAGLKEDLGFLRNIMSSGAAPEGIAMSNLKVERDARPNEYRYRMLLTQGGQRKQDFKGRVQVVAKALQGTNVNSFTFPNAAEGENELVVDFRFYQKVEGQFRLPDDALLKSVEVRILAMPGGQVKLSRTLNLP